MSMMPPPLDEDLDVRYLAHFAGECIGYDDVTVSNVVVGIDAPGGARSAVVSVDGADVRVRLDGGLPAAGTSGMLVTNGSSITVTGHNDLESLQMVRNAAVDAHVAVHFFA